MPETRFVLKRLNWAEHYDGGLSRRPGARDVASFATFDEADAERARREVAARALVNPFACGTTLFDRTHLDEPRLRDWLMDHGVEPPAPKKDGATDWAGWWKKHHKGLSDDKRAAVWAALDKVRFFAVAEEEVRPVGYAVVMVNWEYNDENYDAKPDQCEVITVYRTRARAEAECESQNDVARDAWSDVFDDDEDMFDDDFPMFDAVERLRRRRGLLPGQKLKKGEGVYKNTDGVPFYEVIEVPLEGLE